MILELVAMFKPHWLGRVAGKDDIVLMNARIIFTVFILCIWGRPEVLSRARKRVQRYTIDE